MLLPGGGESLFSGLKGALQTPNKRLSSLRVRAKRADIYKYFFGQHKATNETSHQHGQKELKVNLP